MGSVGDFQLNEAFLDAFFRRYGLPADASEPII
jgi:hypothetical protein